MSTVLQVGVALGDSTALFLVVVRAMLFARELLLLALESVAFVREADRFDCVIVGVVDTPADTHVDPNDVLRTVGHLRWLSVNFNTERGEPLAGRLFLE